MMLPAQRSDRMETETPSETPSSKLAPEAGAAATAQPGPPETELWTGRTSWKHYAGRVSLWVVANVLFAALIGWLASAKRWFDLSGVIYTVLVVVLVSGVIFILPLFISNIARRYRLTSMIKRVDFLVLGFVTGLLVSYLFRPTFLGQRPSFVEWYRDGIQSEQFRGTIIIWAVVGAVVGFIADRFFDAVQRKNDVPDRSAKNRDA
jgi:hypothetical protein